MPLTKSLVESGKSKDILFVKSVYKKSRIEKIRMVEQ